MNKMLQENELYRRKLARAKRIAKIQRRARVDKFLKTRFYVITSFFLFIIIILVVKTLAVEKMIEDQRQSLGFANELLLKLNQDELFKTNIKLMKSVDSLSILIFVYNRRHQRDQQDIVFYTNMIPQKKIRKRTVDNLAFPGHMGKDSMKYDFNLNTDTDTVLIINEFVNDTFIVVDTNNIEIEL